MMINNCQECGKKEILGKLYYVPEQKKWVCDNCFRKSLGLK